MAEAELTSDLLIALTDGIQTSKNMETYYRKYEDEFENSDLVEGKFDSIMSFVNEIYPAEELANTNWTRIHLFYILFTAIGHGLYGITGLSSNLRPNLNKAAVPRARVVLDDISERYDRYTAERVPDVEVPRDFAEFLERSRRATTDTAARIGRANFVCGKLIEAL